MAIRLVRQVDRDARNARSLGLRVERDGDRYQYFALVATSQEQRLEPGPEFNNAAVRVGVAQVREALARLTPQHDRREPIGLRLDVARVEQCIAAGVELPDVVEGQIIDEWTE